MTSNRLEAFSDGVMAIIITIMVLELHVPEGVELSDLKPLIPTFTSYLLSFIYVGIYWNNHHHLWQIVDSVNGKILWANLHLLFWLSLFPFTTSWLGENHISAIPVACYGFVLFMAGVAWYIMARQVVKAEGKNSKVGNAYHNDSKTIASMIIYAVAIALAFYQPWISVTIYTLVAASWFIPDRRIEKLEQPKNMGN